MAWSRNECRQIGHFSVSSFDVSDENPAASSATAAAEAADEVDGIAADDDVVGRDVGEDRDDWLAALEVEATGSELGDHEESESELSSSYTNGLVVFFLPDCDLDKIGSELLLSSSSVLARRFWRRARRLVTGEPASESLVTSELLHDVESRISNLTTILRLDLRSVSVSESESESDIVPSLMHEICVNKPRKIRTIQSKQMRKDKRFNKNVQCVYR